MPRSGRWGDGAIDRCSDAGVARRSRGFREGERIPTRTARCQARQRFLKLRWRTKPLWLLFREVVQIGSREHHRVRQHLARQLPTFVRHTHRVRSYPASQGDQSSRDRISFNIRTGCPAQHLIQPRSKQPPLPPPLRSLLAIVHAPLLDELSLPFPSVRKSKIKSTDRDASGYGIRGPTSHASIPGLLTINHQP